jgi:general secretion pathway protein B
LVVLLAVLARGWFTPGSAQPLPQPAAQTRDGNSGSDHPARTTPAGAAAGAANSEHFSPLDAAPVYAPEVPVAASPPQAPPSSSPSPSPSIGTAGAGGRAVRARDPVLTEDDYKPKDEEVLPSITELSLTGDQALPELHLDVHVFATKAADRFVYINMRKYHEGATLQEGPTIEHIRRDGVVMNYQGLRFLLPRQ